MQKPLIEVKRKNSSASECSESCSCEEHSSLDSASNSGHSSCSSKSSRKIFQTMFWYVINYLNYFQIKKKFQKLKR